MYLYDYNPSEKTVVENDIMRIERFQLWVEIPRQIPLLLMEEN